MQSQNAQLAIDSPTDFYAMFGFSGTAGCCGFARACGLAVALLFPVGSPCQAQDYVYRSQFGVFGGGAGQFNGPAGVAIDPVSGNIVVADSDNHRLQVFGRTGGYLGQVGEPGLGDGQFGFSLAGVAIDPQTRNVVVVDRHLNRVQRFGADGSYLGKFGTYGDGDGQFAHPDGVAVDAATGDIVVADSDNHRVQIFNRAGVYQRQFGTYGIGDGQFIRPAGVAVDPASRNIFVVDKFNHRVQLFSSAGSYMGQFGEFGSGNGQFQAPTAIAFDPASRHVVVGDAFNFRMQVFDPAGVYVGQFGGRGSADGLFAPGLDIFGGTPGDVAMLGLAIDPLNGNLAVTDWGNSRVQLFAATSVPRAGWWWNPAESGRGFFLERNATGVLFFASFLYSPTGRATWYASALHPGAAYFSGSLDAYARGQTLEGSYQPPGVAEGAEGPLSLAFTDGANGTLVWKGGTVPIRRFSFGDGNVTPPFRPQTGWWWNPAESGRGFSLEVQGNSMFLAGYMYDALGEPIWYLSSGVLDGQVYQGTWTEYANGQTLGGPYAAPGVVNPAVGAVAIHFSSQTAGILTLPDGRAITILRFSF